MPNKRAPEIINHRAKRGGSLFEGGSAEEEGWRSDPYVAGGLASVRQFSPIELPLKSTDLPEILQE